jgi:membrane-bound inhibitor of C-type lysozyme
MIKKTFLIASLGVITLFASCNQSSTAANPKEQTAAANVITQNLKDKDGNAIQLIFDNNKDEVTINYKNETSVLKSQKAASGMWYKNDSYELRGKGNDLTLVKGNQIIYEHADEIVEIVAKSNNGDVLNMTFNNTAGTVKAYLNGGEQIDLEEQKAASGIWYKNDHYELSGKGDHYQLLKDGKTVFSN